MSLLFFRKYSFEVQIKNQAQQFCAELGFFSPLNIETGMTADLPHVDQVFGDFARLNVVYEDRFDLIHQLQKYFAQSLIQSELKKIKLTQLDKSSIAADLSQVMYSQVLNYKNLFQVEISSLELLDIFEIEHLLKDIHVKTAVELLDIQLPVSCTQIGVHDLVENTSYWRTLNL